MDFNRDKFKALVHYVISRVREKEKLGSTKLAKIVWLSDMRAYELTGESITGATYIREKYGPVPQQMMPMRGQLEDEGKIRHWRDRLGKYDKDVFESLTEPDTSLFTQEQLKSIEYFTRYVCDEHTATSISEESHDYVWEIAKLGEVIPYHAFLAKRLREPTNEELERARKRARRQGLIA